MVENHELKSEITMNSTNVKLITENKKLLEETTLAIKEEIKSSIDRLIGVLKSREKQLLRQVEAVHIQQLSLIQSNSELLTIEPLLKLDLSSTYEIESTIRNLGELEVVGKNGITVKNTEPYKVEEYQDADKDHESFNKSIQQSEDKVEEIVENSTNYDSKDIRSCEINLSTSDDSGGTFNDSNLSCSHDSSFDFSSEIENKSDLCSEPNILSSSNCTVIYRPVVTPTSNQRSFETETKTNNEKDSSLDLLNENCEAETLNRNSNFHKDINANKESNFSVDSIPPTEKITCKNDRRQIRRNSEEHPKQIQQWLQEILVETETEPMIHEIEQFSEISKARLSGQFPLET